MTTETEQPLKAEANLLRLPVFALKTKGLSVLDGIKCKGRVRREGEAYTFTWETMRAANLPYPGPLSRAIHMALLAIVRDQGLPFTNPVRFQWRELCRRLDVVYSGKTVSEMKQAIRSTLGLSLFSTGALFDKVHNRPIHATEQGMHLYEQVVFHKGYMPDGSIAETNCVWFSQWYLNNLNALFTAPLDYQLWRKLDAGTNQASRLYEFCVFAFYNGTPQLVINYPTLAQYMPVKTMAYLSEAQRQLSLPFTLLAEHRVISGWGLKTHGDTMQLEIGRGPVLGGVSTGGGGVAEIELEAKEVYSEKTPEQLLVIEFHQKWSGAKLVTPKPKELELASQIIERIGVGKARQLLPVLIKKLKTGFPNAKTFLAVQDFVDAAIRETERVQKLDSTVKTAAEVRHATVKAVEAGKVDDERAKIVMGRMDDASRAALREKVVAASPGIARFSALLEGAMLSEIRKQLATEGGKS